MSSVEQVIDTLNALDEKELRQLHDRTAFLLKNSNTIDDSNSKYERMMYDGINEILKEMLCTKCPPFECFTKLSLYPKYKAAIKALVLSQP